MFFFFLLDRLLNVFVLQEKMIELGLADGSLIDELMELTAQSINHLEIQEHFNIIKEIGRGKYGKVLLVTHRFRGINCLKYELLKPLESSIDKQKTHSKVFVEKS